jgi:hypothetical protein
MMKKLTLLLLTIGFIGLSNYEAKAQALGTNYQNAIGGRFGVANGITFKHFMNERDALDFILNFRAKKHKYSSFRLVGLYEIHNPIVNAPGLQWYYGIGGGIGSYTYKDDSNRDSNVYLSVDGVLGLDYKFNGAPINIALDWKPSFDISPDQGLDFEGVGLSIRFAF